jgi:hypothetical protein
VRCRVRVIPSRSRQHAVCAASILTCQSTYSRSQAIRGPAEFLARPFRRSDAPTNLPRFAILKESVFRVVSSSLLSLLLLATLMWGGCISCPQFFMTPNAEKSCCDQAGKCKRQSEQSPIEKECQRMPLEPPSIGGMHHTLAVVALPTPVPEFASEPPVTLGVMYSEALPLEYSPPDVQVLNSTFLI